MVVISLIESAENDFVTFEELPDSDFRNTPARVSRTMTLDGGAVIDHRGFYDADRRFDIKARLDDQEKEDLLWSIYLNNIFVNLACREGFFKGAISKMELKFGEVNFTFLVKE